MAVLTPDKLQTVFRARCLAFVLTDLFGQIISSGLTLTDTLMTCHQNQSKPLLTGELLFLLQILYRAHWPVFACALDYR